MSLLGILLSGVFSAVLWFEVSRTDAFTSKQRGAFVGGAIVATLLLLISIVGLIGAIARKLTFVTAYTVGLYVHFLINFIVAMYLLFVILHATHEDTVDLCEHVLTDAQSKDQCDTLFNSVRALYAGLASFILIVELYGAIVATRYFYQLRGEKREARKPRHLRTASAADSGRVLPGYMRYRDSSGATVYDSYYFPSSATKGHSRGASAYSPADSDIEGATPIGLYDPPNAGLLSPKYDGLLDSEDDYKNDDHEDHEYRDHDHDSALRSPPGLEPSGGADEAVRGNTPDSDSLR